MIDLDVCYGENLLKALEDYLGPDIHASVERLLKQPLAKNLPEPLQRVVLGQYSCSEGMYFVLHNTFCREEWEPNEFLSLRQQVKEYGLDEFIEILDFNDFDDLDEDEEIVTAYCGLAEQFNFLDCEIGGIAMKSKDNTMIGQDIPFERIRRITGYLVGSVDRFNNAKRAEEKDRVKHEIPSGL